MGLEWKKAAVDKEKNRKVHKLLVRIALTGESNVKKDIQRQGRVKTAWMIGSIAGWVHPQDKWARFGSNPGQPPPPPAKPVNYFVYQDQGTLTIRPGHFLRNGVTQLQEQMKSWKL